MKCPKCGKEAGDSRRCGGCGASMVATTRVAKPNGAANTASDQPASAGSAGDSAPNTVVPRNQLVIPLPSIGASGRTLAIIGGGVALALVFVLVLVAGGSATFDGTSAISMKTSTEKVLNGRTEDEKKAFYSMDTRLRTTFGFAGSSGRLGDIRGDLDRGEEMVRVFSHGKTYEQFMEEAPKAIEQVKQAGKQK